MQQPERMHRSVETWPSTSKKMVATIVESLLAEKEMGIMPIFNGDGKMYLNYLRDNVMNRLGETETSPQIEMIVGAVNMSLIYELNSIEEYGHTTKLIDFT
jgi:hypothetical protein